MKLYWFVIGVLASVACVVTGGLIGMLLGETL